MAEGHAVHGMARRVNQLAGQRVRSISTPHFDASALDGQVLHSAEAHGKHLLVHFPSVSSTVHLHLGMAGRVSVRKQARALGPDGLPRTDPPAPAHLWWRAVAARHRVDVTAPTICELLDPAGVQALHNRLGPDPLRADGDPERFWRKVRASRRAIGLLLLDQSVIAGVGNVYRAEVLYRLRLSPFTPGRDLSDSQLEQLWRECADLLAVGLGAGWIVADAAQLAAARDLLNRGETVPRWRKVYAVYGRSGLPCATCGSTVRGERLGLQRMFWCPICQHAGDPPG